MTLTAWVRQNRTFVQTLAESICPVMPWTEQRLVRFVRRNPTLAMSARAAGVRLKADTVHTQEG